jgi:hypothetical protein
MEAIHQSLQLCKSQWAQIERIIHSQQNVKVFAGKFQKTKNILSKK